MSDEFRAALDKCWLLDKDKYGEYYYEIDADYRDEMSDEDCAKIIRAEYPEQMLYEMMFDWYLDSEGYILSDIANELRKLRPDEIDEAEWEQEIDDFLYENPGMYFEYPYDHYLDQEFYVNIVLDTGDGNYDFTLNYHYPAWQGNEGAIDPKASLCWLAKQQGYTPGQLRDALNDGDIENPAGFLQSCRQEMANVCTHMNALTFLVRMNLRDLITLNKLVRMQDRNGRLYDAAKRPYCGYIVLDKKTMCGLYDGWNGSGSVLEIELEKDVKIPIKYIFTALPDEVTHGTPYSWSVNSVYGMCGSAWRDTVKEIHIPNEFRKEIA